MDKKDLTRVLKEIGIALELTEDNAFKSRAYHNAARSIDSSAYTLQELVDGKASELKGLGESLVQRIHEFHLDGRIELHQELLAKIPAGLWDILQISGLGSKRVRALYELLGITGLAELEYACNENRLLELKGFGSKTQDNVIAGIAEVKARRGQALYPEALSAALPLLHGLRNLPMVGRCELAGGLRRQCPVVDEVRLVISTNSPEQMAQIQVAITQDIAWEIAQSDKLVGKLPSGLSIVLVFCRAEEFAWTWLEQTGSDEHVRQLVERLSDPMRQLQDEAAIYTASGLKWIHPALREGMDEISWAAECKLPELVSIDNLQGTLHTHTTWSDGAGTIAEMAAAAQVLGWNYLGFGDHSQTAVYAGGLTPDRVREQWRAIDDHSRQAPEIRLLKGIESDILPDGSLDYDDELLAGFDYVVASVHSSLRQSQEQMMQRLFVALRHPRTTILGHPTGRLLLGRGESAVDMPSLIAEAANLGKVLELNANPHRLDLDWKWCREAKRQGVKIAINPDAHRVSGLLDIQYGILIAQKAGLSRHDLLHY